MRLRQPRARAATPCTRAGTGTEGIQVMEETGGAIDLVVSDVVMPEMDGPSLLRRAAERGRI